MTDYKPILDRIKYQAQLKKEIVWSVGVGLVVIIILLISHHYAMKNYNSQLEQIDSIKNQMQQLKQDQDKLEGQLIRAAMVVDVMGQNLNVVNEKLDITVELEVDTGKASYYDYTLASGWSSKGHRVCASRDYPRGTILLVTNVENNKSVECLVTDFGPDKSVHPDRIVDMSSHSFSQIGELSKGIINVKVSKVN